MSPHPPGDEVDRLIRDNKNSLLYGLSQRLEGLKKISKPASFKASLTVANGIFMSKLTFMIPL